MRLLAVLALTSLLSQSAPARTVKAEFSEKLGLSAWEIDGGGVWKARGNLLVLEEAAVPGGPIRRPGTMAVHRSQPFTDFTLNVELRSTAPVELEVRDCLLIFGYQSPTQFYYVHLAAKTDAVHNGIFLVDRADRRRLDQPTSTAKLKDQAWHRVRLERDTTTGSIRVFFDADTTPILSATDKTLTSGRIGIGSFDETAEFRLFEVTGR